MAAFRFFHFHLFHAATPAPAGVRSAYDDTTPQATRCALTAQWSLGAQGRPACRWKA
jgi:hypothetical protein